VVRRGAGRRRERRAAVRPPDGDRRQANGSGVALATAPDPIVARDRDPSGVCGAAQTLVTEPEDDSGADRPTMAPFLGALSIIVLS